MSQGFNVGQIDVLNSGAIAEAQAAAASLPQRRHLPARRWISPGTFLRVVGLALLAVILGGWLLTLLNAR